MQNIIIRFTQKGEIKGEKSLHAVNIYIRNICII